METKLVVRGLAELEFESVIIAACQFGLKLRKPKSGDEDNSIMKHWRIDTDCSELLKAFHDELCKGGHGHVDCMAGHAKKSAHYPAKMAKAMIIGLQENTTCQRWVQKTSQTTQT